MLTERQLGRLGSALVKRFERYVALGDSTTEGLEDPDGRGGYRGWANRFAEHLAAAFGGISYANLAIRGRMAKQVLDEQLGQALSMTPDVVTVVAGVNDVLRPSFNADDVAADVATMISSFADTGATVLTFTMPDMTQVMPMARLLRGRLGALNSRLRDTAARTGALLLDLARYPVGGDPRLWHGDRLHANSLGHERIGRGLAHTVGLEGFTDWSAALPSLPAPSLADRLKAEWRWSREYLLPWVVRHARGASSGDGREPKRAALTPFEPS